MDYTTILENNRKTAYKIAAESIVLLENDGVLPLKGVERIAVFGPGARHTLYGGGGSSHVRGVRPVSICEGLAANGLLINSDTWLDRYDGVFKLAQEKYARDVRGAFFPPNINKLTSLIMSGHEYPDMEVSQTGIESSPADAAVYVLTRKTMEGADNHLIAGEYFLTEPEKDSIARLAKAYNKFILVINSGSPVDMSILDTISGINAVIYMGLAGMEGGQALADIMCGIVNPSGRLTDTWPVKIEDYPASVDYKEYPINGKEPVTVKYNEGNLVGYRFYETNHVPVRYSFGYGRSYTEFSVSGANAVVKNNIVYINANITNTGSVPGKTSYQIYCGRYPTIAGGEYRNLVAFAKTGVLEPLQSAAISIAFDAREMAAFNENEDLYVVSEGEYYVFVALSATYITDPVKIELQHDSFKTRINKETGIDVPYEVGAAFGRFMKKLPVKDLVKLCVGTGSMGGKFTVNAPGCAGHTTDDFKSMGVYNMELADGPCGLRLAPRYGKYSDGSCKAIEPEYDAFNYFPGIVKKFLLANPKKSKAFRQQVTAYPAPINLAQTWNEDLMEEFGRAIASEMELYNVTFWLAPAVNVHRSFLCGRNFEYYSEDPFYSGKCGAAVVRAVQKTPGKYAVVKHFCCNNKEDNRMFSDSIVKENVLRNIYLKPFEIVIREGGAKAVMTSYNKVNGSYMTENSKLIRGILRGEYGFDGLIMTDWTATNQTAASDALASGVDLIMPGSKKDCKMILKAIKKGTLKASVLAKHVARILSFYYEAYEK